MDASISGKWFYKAGISGSVSVPDGAVLLQLRAHSSGGGSVQIYGGDSIPIIAGESAFILRFSHLLAQSPPTAAPSPATKQVIFTGTDSYLVEFVQVGF